MKKISKIWILVIVVAVLAIASMLLSGGSDKHEITFETTKVTTVNIKNSITATGTIEPVTSVTVGTQVSGIVSKLYVDYNTIVKKGQVIAELDRTNLNSELRNAQASLQSAQSAESYEKSNYSRYKVLYSKGLVSADEYENVKLSYDKAHQATLQAREQVNKAQTNLGYATITSPIDGVVLSKSVEEGQTVAASFSTPELFTIAKDLTNMQVVADIDEADIGEVSEGQRVTFTVDAYPDDTFEGTVTQVRQEATTTNNVVTYEVVINAPNTNLKLKPGLTANVTIYTSERNGVVAVPNKALRFSPTQDIVGKKYKIKDCSGKNKLWTIEKDNTLKAHQVTIGATDGINTEIIKGMKVGDVIVSQLKELMAEDESEASSDEERSPFAPGPPGKKKK